MSRFPMEATYHYKPNVKVKLWDEVYEFDSEGRLSTGDRRLQTAIESSEVYRSGRIRKYEPLRVAVKVYSPVLEGYLWVVQDGKNWLMLLESGEPVYDAEEISELERTSPSPEVLRAAHDVKKVFSGSRIVGKRNRESG